MELTPKQIVRELDRYIIGQDEAKRAVAVALRNRYRRSQLPQEIRDEIVPKNILMVGPTGVGKTEIARRLAKLVDAPFVKVEATKFTEVGYVGRDVESIIRDLVEASVRICKAKASEKVKARATVLAEEQIVDLILHPNRHGIIKKPLDEPYYRDIAIATSAVAQPSTITRMFCEHALEWARDTSSAIAPATAEAPEYAELAK